MDYVKREDNSIIDEETYKMYLDTVSIEIVLKTLFQNLNFFFCT